MVIDHPASTLSRWGQDGAMLKSAAVAVCPDSAVGDSPVMYWLRVVING
jgi:hypothetical protein